MPSILIVCTANICRSPMAEAQLRHLLEEADVPGEWRVSSAGTWASDGLPASESGVLVMQEQGLDTSAHLSRAVNEAIVAEADLILTMTAGHAEALGAEYPSARSRIHLLSEMAGPRYDVWDPFGRSLAEYRRTANELAGLVERGLERIISLARQNEASR